MKKILMGLRYQILFITVSALLVSSSFALYGAVDQKAAEQAEAKLAVQQTMEELVSSNDNLKEMVGKLDNMKGATLKVWSLYADGELVGCANEKETLENSITAVEDKLTVLSEDGELLDKYFREDIVIREDFIKAVDTDMIYGEEDLTSVIITGTTEKRYHTVESGDSFWTIAEKYGLSVSDVESANPSVEPGDLRPGDEVSLLVPKPLLTLVTVEKMKYSEYVDFETTYEETSSLYKGQVSIKESGKQGENAITAEVYRENGNLVKKDVVEKIVVSEPQTKVLYKGTKDPPPLIGTGNFVRPTSRGTITSGFGMRWGRLHTGVDIAMPSGNAVFASDGGVVRFSGYRNGYGYTVIIDHGGGMSTLYAHNSKLLVSAGTKVYKGQQVAVSGSSGRSTGPHLHFEVRVNDVPKNPKNYVSF